LERKKEKKKKRKKEKKESRFHKTGLRPINGFSDPQGFVDHIGTLKEPLSTESLPPSYHNKQLTCTVQSYTVLFL
jgi:hypothetical protein